MFCEKMQSFMGELNTFAGDCKCFARKRKFVATTQMFFFKKMQMFWKKPQSLLRERNTFPKQCKCFAKKGGVSCGNVNVLYDCKVSKGNAILLRENANVLVHILFPWQTFYEQMQSFSCVCKSMHWSIIFDPIS